MDNRAKAWDIIEWREQSLNLQYAVHGYLMRDDSRGNTFSDANSGSSYLRKGESPNLPNGGSEWISSAVRNPESVPSPGCTTAAVSDLLDYSPAWRRSPAPLLTTLQTALALDGTNDVQHPVSPTSLSCHRITARVPSRQRNSTSLSIFEDEQHRNSLVNPIKDETESHSQLVEGLKYTACERHDHSSATGYALDAVNQQLPINNSASNCWDSAVSGAQPPARVTARTKNQISNKPDGTASASKVSQGRVAKRTFGREVNPNAVVKPKPRATPGRKRKAKAEPEVGAESTVEHPVSVSPKMSEEDHLIDEVEEDANNDTVPFKDNDQVSLQTKLKALNDPSTKQPSSIPKRIPAKSTRKPTPPGQWTGTATTRFISFKPDKPQPPFPPMFAKRPPLEASPIPPNTTRHAYENTLSFTPHPQQPICLCGQSARTYDVEIAQCSSKDCLIVWFHRECLDKRAKLQVRFGTMLCQVCRNEQEFRVRDRENGWDREGLEKWEVQWAIGKEERDAVLENPGGFVARPNPYGMGLEVEVGRQGVAMEKVSSEDALETGYVKSQPHLLTEAYENARVHRETADVAYDLEVKVRAEAEYDGQVDDDDEEVYDEDEEEVEYDASATSVDVGTVDALM